MDGKKEEMKLTNPNAKIGDEREVDQFGNCIRCGGIHYGTGLLCVFNEKSKYFASRLRAEEGMGATRCTNFPCAKPKGHDGPCSSAEEGRVEAKMKYDDMRSAAIVVVEAMHGCLSRGNLTISSADPVSAALWLGVSQLVKDFMEAIHEAN